MSGTAEVETVDNTCGRYILVLLLLFLMFSVWAVVRPPFQSPDEFAHLHKVTSAELLGWRPNREAFERGRALANPLASAELLNRLPHEPTHVLSNAEIQALKNYTWQSQPGSYDGYSATALYYPPLYYRLVGGIGTPLVKGLGLSPYDAVYLYRLVTAFLAALLWLGIYFVLSQITELRSSFFLFALSTAVVPFLSSSISPDAVLIPLSGLAILTFYRAVRVSSIPWSLTCVFILWCTALTKPSFVLLPPALAIATTVISPRTGRWQRTYLWACSLLMLGTVPPYLSYYRNLRLVEEPVGKAPLIAEYFSSLWDDRLGWLFRGYWGSFGWLEYGVPQFFVLIIAVLLVVNAVFSLLDCPAARFQRFLFILSLIYGISLFVLEYFLSAQAGLILQGRYFLPIALGVASLFVHRRKILTLVTATYLSIVQVVALTETVERYYGDNYPLMTAALPFTSSAQTTSATVE